MPIPSITGPISTTYCYRCNWHAASDRAYGSIPCRAQFNTPTEPTGWICPVCGAGVAPTMQRCTHEGSK